MWYVEYSRNGETVLHPEGFMSRKSARHWCKRVGKPSMVLVAPDGNREPYEVGVS